MPINSDIPEFAAISDADRAMWGDPDDEFFLKSIGHIAKPTFWEGYGKALKQDFGSRHPQKTIIIRFV